MSYVFGDPRVPQRIWDKLVQRGDCWVWTGASTVHGGQVRWRGKTVRPSRVTYGILARGWDGPSAADVMANLCGETLCCNPAHNEERTWADHATIQGRQRFDSVTHCPHGHKYTAENLEWNVRADGGRSKRCVQCRKDRQKRQRRERIAAGLCPVCGKKAKGETQLCQPCKEQHKVYCARYLDRLEAE